MDASFCFPIKTQHFSPSPLFTPKPKFHSIPSQSIHPQQLSYPRRRPSNRGSLTAAIGCAKGGPAVTTEVERELEEEMKSIGGKWREKCDGEGIVEIMECLEREAIMGEDEGREPTDYNRRAIIFDKSSRVFQALKEKDDNKS